ncbi:MAG TPA: glycoside hydrolase family 2 TIM barrel-domain containing protein [Gemmatimonadales bacterium]
MRRHTALMARSVLAEATLVVAAALVAPCVTAQSGHTLRTRWADDVTPIHVLPEYPRPQMVRPAWINLNGTWDYAITARDAPRPAQWDGKILVPFAVESQLSGVQRAVSPSQRVWYRRTFRRPALSRDDRLLLHFGAVDWHASVWLNGAAIGEHQGGYDPFTFDITEALAEGDQELVVAVWDPTNSGSQPRGKQVLDPRSIWYTAVTGIWQTVWLEPVPAEHIDDLVVVPDIDAGTVRVALTTNGDAPSVRVTATVLADGQVIATTTQPMGEEVTLGIPDPRLWSPTTPFLYGLEVSLSTGDAVRSYFGMRKIAVASDSLGMRRLFLNNAPLFQYGMLDQGWWPDGLYTPPTDAAMRFDIATMQQLGFNMIRKHVKVEPARWYYLADSIGMLVWQDMPSGDNETAESRTQFAVELQRMVGARRNHPSIVMWVPFNEGWGQHDTESIVAWLEAYDPSRLVNNASGWTDRRVGHVADVHAYPGPSMGLLEPSRAAVLGEFGGLGLPLAGHTWVDSNNWGYRNYGDTLALREAYADLLYQLSLYVPDGLAAAVYTQTTDVEVEVNGLMTYDRAIIKLVPEDATAAARPLYTSPYVIRTVAPTSLRDGQTWRYTETAPPGEWPAVEFDDGSWSEGPGGFGRANTPGAVVRTPWTTSDIWLRRSFDLGSGDLVGPHWRIHHDEDAEVYLNGQLVLRLDGYTTGYRRIPLDATALAVLRTGRNVLAIHVHQTRGGQYIDLGLDEVIKR